MKSFIIDDKNQGQRLNKYCARLLPAAGQSFIYKMLRKKNITLNGKKADGSEIVKAGDEVKFFLSDETFSAFAASDSVKKVQNEPGRVMPIGSNRIVYEDENIIVCYKASGELSQKARPEDVSINERIAAYLAETKAISGNFTFGLANRLDRNTDGLVIGGKNPFAQAQITELFRNHSIEKYYLAAVYGGIKEKEKHLKLYLSKNETENKVSISSEKQKDSVLTETVVYNEFKGKRNSLLKIRLLTGKSHQIRACLAYIGCPVVGDPKYGNPEENAFAGRKYGIRSQLLTAYELRFPKDFTTLPGLAGKSIKTEPGEKFEKFIDEEIKAEA